MNKEFIPYEQALELKELGFDEPCLSYYEGESFSYHLATMTSGDNYITPAPLYQQAFRWFREKYQITSEVLIEQYRRRTDKKWMFSIIYLTEDAMYEHSKTTFISYEEAELACLKKLIEIVKNK